MKVVYRDQGQVIQIADMGSTFVKEESQAAFDAVLAAFHKYLYLNCSNLRAPNLYTINWSDPVRESDGAVEIDLEDDFAGVLTEQSGHLTLCLSEPGVKFPVRIPQQDEQAPITIDIAQSREAYIDWVNQQLEINLLPK